MQAHRPRFEVLEGLPPYGAPALPYPESGEGSHREGFVVRFFRADGGSWVGNFQDGLSSLCTVVEHPDGRRLVVIARGQGYVVDPEVPGRCEEAGCTYDGTLTADGLLILITNTELEAVGPSGPMWRSRRVSWDGLCRVMLDPDGRTLIGQAWSPLEDAWIPFRVDLLTGAVEGGSYSLEQRSFHSPSISRSGASIPFFTLTRNCTASEPSMSRWS